MWDRYRSPNVNFDLPLSQFTGAISQDQRKVVFTDVWTISSHMVNDFRGNYSRFVQLYGVPDQYKNFPNVGIDDLGLSFGPEGNSPQSTIQNTYQLLENLSYTAGRHQLKFGVDYRRLLPLSLPQNGLLYGPGSINNVIKKEGLDGIKFFLDAPTEGKGAEAWVLFRASGTEPLLRIYAEAASPDLVNEVLATAEKFVQSA